MKLRYRGYEHDDGEVSFTWDMQTIFNEFKEGRGHRVTVVVTGVKQAASVSALTTALNALEAAYAFNGGDLIFLDDDGNETVHTLRTGNTFGGVRVLKFAYLDQNPGVWGSGTEYVNKRTFQITLEADVLIRGGLLKWHEDVATIGVGGPRVKWLLSLTGRPQKQRLNRATTYTTIQSGFALGDTTWPFPATPLWPAFEHSDRRRLQRGTPRFVPGGATEYPISWEFHFESPGSLAANPTLIQR